MPTVRQNALSVGDDVQTTIARGLIVYTMPNLVMGQVFRNVEGEFSMGGSYSMESLTRIAAAVGAEPTATSFTAPDEGPVTLTINQFYYGAVQVGSIIQAVATHDWVTLYRGSIKDGLKVQIDAGIAALVAGFTQTQGTLATPITDAQIRRAMQYLDDADAPQADRSAVISPAEKADKLGLERWSSRDYVAEGALTRGQFADMYNAKWHVSTNLTANGGGRDNVFAHKDAIMFAIRKQAGAETFDLNNPNTLSREIALTAIWGQVEKRDLFGVWLKGQ